MRGPSCTSVQQMVREKKKDRSDNKKTEGPKEESRYAPKLVEFKKPIDADLELGH